MALTARQMSHHPERMWKVQLNTLSIQMIFTPDSWQVQHCSLYQGMVMLCDT